jgi:hypothetical protein
MRLPARRSIELLVAWPAMRTERFCGIPLMPLSIAIISDFSRIWQKDGRTGSRAA